jgi:hypothetical protein
MINIYYQVKGFVITESGSKIESEGYALDVCILFHVCLFCICLFYVCLTLFVFHEFFCVVFPSVWFVYTCFYCSFSSVKIYGISKLAWIDLISKSAASVLTRQLDKELVLEVRLPRTRFAMGEKFEMQVCLEPKKYNKMNRRNKEKTNKTRKKKANKKSK